LRSRQLPQVKAEQFPVEEIQGHACLFESGQGVFLGPHHVREELCDLCAVEVAWVPFAVKQDELPSPGDEGLSQRWGMTAVQGSLAELVE
jgi:hypothetical protein